MTRQTRIESRVRAALPGVEIASVKKARRSLTAGLTAALLLSCGCATLPTLPPWQNISAERESRKQDTLRHIDRTRGQAAEIEQASFAKEPGAQAVVPPSRTADRLPAMGANDAALDPALAAGASTLTPDQALRADADRAVAMGDLEEAIDLYRRLIAAQPNDAEAHHALALVAEQMNLHEEASRHYLEATRLAPNETLYRLCFEAHADLMANESPVARVAP